MGLLLEKICCRFQQNRQNCRSLNAFSFPFLCSHGHCHPSCRCDVAQSILFRQFQGPMVDLHTNTTLKKATSFYSVLRSAVVGPNFEMLFSRRIDAFNVWWCYFKGFLTCYGFMPKYHVVTLVCNGRKSLVKHDHSAYKEVFFNCLFRKEKDFCRSAVKIPVFDGTFS